MMKHQALLIQDHQTMMAHHFFVIIVVNKNRVDVTATIIPKLDIYFVGNSIIFQRLEMVYSLILF